MKDVMSDAHIRKVAKRVVLGNIESKFFDTNSTNQGFDHSGVIGDLSDIPVGDTSSERTGQYVRLQKFKMRGTLISGALGTSYTARIIVLKWHPNDSTAPNVGTILAAVGAASATSSDYTLERKLDYTILKDIFLCPKNTSNGNLTFQISLDLKNAKAQFEQAGTDGSGKLYLLYISDCAPANQPTINWYTRLWFKDA